MSLCKRSDAFSRRDFLRAAGVLGGTMACPALAGAASPAAFDVAPAQAALQRLLPRHATQFRLLPLARGKEADRFEVRGRAGAIGIRGTSPVALLTGVHWYLKYVADAQISWAGSQTGRLPATLPASMEPLACATSLAHRYALNDTDDGYSGPYREFADWEKLIDVLALHGFNEALVTVGQEAVFHRLLQQFGYSEAEARTWIPGQAHQPWWWLQNISAFGGPVPLRDIEKRIALGRRIVARMRELGITPVFPGYYGSVPVDFVRRNPEAKVIAQGDWAGFERPGWLDPTTPLFARIAAAFYAEQQKLFGTTSMFKMDPLHEGGLAGDLDVGAAGRAIQSALLRAHADATWVLLGWQKNPRADMLRDIDRSRVLIVDGISDRWDKIDDREHDWLGAPYAFGTIPNFGGHTTLGARCEAWQRKYFTWRDRPDGKLTGIAFMPEGAYRDAAAMELFSELPWRASLDRAAWFARYAKFRYGGEDENATIAWKILGATAYGWQTDEWSETQDSLFAARPSLEVKSAATWSPGAVYDTAAFARALPALLAVAPPLRDSDAYRYDLVDVARQALANHARDLLPRIREAYTRRDRETFTKWSMHWLETMDLSERLLATHRSFLLGPWLAQARAWGMDAAGRARCEYDARSLLTTWGPRSTDKDGLHDYANRDWSGLVADLYRPRWKRFFATLDESLENAAEPETIDWFGIEDAWARATKSYPTEPTGSSHGVARDVAALLAVQT